MKLADGHTRRRVLRSGAALLAGAVAGCAGNGTGTATPVESVFRGTSFDGPDLVVELRADHGASRVNLVGPDGSAFAGADVAAGATTVRIPILRIQPGSAFEHYTPGVHELVAVLEDRTESVELELRPDLRVTDIEPYSEGTQTSDAGRLAVTVENDGTAPSWVYQVSYRESPNWTANNELSGDPGSPLLFRPTNSEDLIIGPDTDQIFVGSIPPLLFEDDTQSACEGAVGFTVIIGRGIGDSIEHRIRATLGGEVQSAGLGDDYTCSAIEVEMLDGGTGG